MQKRRSIIQGKVNQWAAKIHAIEAADEALIAKIKPLAGSIVLALTGHPLPTTSLEVTSDGVHIGIKDGDKDAFVSLVYGVCISLLYVKGVGQYVTLADNHADKVVAMAKLYHQTIRRCEHNRHLLPFEKE